MIKLTLIILFYSPFFVSYAQINIKVDECPNIKAAIFSLEGERTSFLDSVVSKNGVFKFNLSDRPTGIYRLSFSGNKWIVQ